MFQNCTRAMSATCLCAVSVRVGNDVFGVDQCRRFEDGDDEFNRFVNYFVNGDITPGFQIFRKDYGNKFEVLANYCYSEI